LKVDLSGPRRSEDVNKRLIDGGGKAGGVCSRSRVGVNTQDFRQRGRLDVDVEDVEVVTA
jgi:hypothetical protein